MTLFKLSTPIMEGRGAKGKIAQQTRTGHNYLYISIFKDYVQPIIEGCYRGVVIERRRMINWEIIIIIFGYIIIMSGGPN